MIQSGSTVTLPRLLTQSKPERLEALWGWGGFHEEPPIIIKHLLLC